MYVSDTMISDLKEAEEILDENGYVPIGVSVCCAIGILEKLKEQQPKTGHWIEHEGFNEDRYYDCSVCDCSLREIHRGMGFCPYCGAKMDNPL